MFCMSQLLGRNLTAFLPFSCMVESVPPNWFNGNSRVTIYSIVRAMQSLKCEIPGRWCDEGLAFMMPSRWVPLLSALCTFVFSFHSEKGCFQYHFLHIWIGMDGTFSRDSLLILLWRDYVFLQWLMTDFTPLKLLVYFHSHCASSHLLWLQGSAIPQSTCLFKCFIFGVG